MLYTPLENNNQAAREVLHVTIIIPKETRLTHTHTLLGKTGLVCALMSKPVFDLCVRILKRIQQYTLYSTTQVKPSNCISTPKTTCVFFLVFYHSTI